MPLVSITRLRVRSWRYLLPFFIGAIQSAQQAKKSEGALAVAMLRQPQRVFWTRSVWASEEAMKAFMLSGAHRRVMRSLLEWCDEAAVGHWTQDLTEPPDWQEAHRRLQTEGRLSKVNHPSDDQRAFRIPPLPLPIRGETVMK